MTQSVDDVVKTSFESKLKISEVIFKTSRLEEMQAWYERVLGLKPFFERTPPPGTIPQDFGGQTRAADLRMCFFRVSGSFPFVQTIGIFEEPGTATDRSKEAPGLHHIQLMCPTIGDLCQKFEELERSGCFPHRATNHGIMTSFYYRDPDGNIAELTAQNFSSFEEMTSFMASAEFAANPSGDEIDAKDYVARFNAGEPISELIRLKSI